MKRLFQLFALLFLIAFFSWPAHAQTLRQKEEETRLEIKALRDEGLISEQKMIELAAPLSEIFKIEESLRPAGVEAQDNTVELCDKAILVSDLFSQVDKLKSIKVKNRRARERLKPLFDDLEKALDSFGPADGGECVRLKGAV